MDRYIILFRKDLQKHKEDLDFDLISIYDFKNSSITLEQINQAYVIFFVDEDKNYKLLKSMW